MAREKNMNSWKLHSPPDLKDRSHVFVDRKAAGERLATMLKDYRGSDAMVLAIPAGGVPVAAVIAATLALPLLVIPVSKILFPWTTESGFGAVAWDETEWLNPEMINAANLDAKTIAMATEQARVKIRRRLEQLYGNRPLPSFSGKTLIVVDDGIAAGSTMRAAINALQKAEAGHIILAVPTGYETTLHNLLDRVDGIYCANRRGGYRFAVADAYTNWCDVSEAEVLGIVQQFEHRQGENTC
jgi:predicted phosphoribosyltransferase